MSVRITEREAGDVTILDLEGTITLGEGSASFRNAIRRLLDEGKKKLLVNMEDVTYVDSSGIGELVSAFTTVTNQHGVIKMMTLRKKPRDLLQITKLYTVYETFGGEKAALRSFQPELCLGYCRCPACGKRGDPLWDDAGEVEAQVCPLCDARFTVGSGGREAAEVPVKSVQIESYLNEYFEILAGPPFRVRVVGRLSLFTTFALRKAWRAVPTPRRVIFDLKQATEIDEEGRNELLTLLSEQKKDTRAAVSLEGLSREQLRVFPAGPPFYATEEAAVAALGDISDTPRWRVQVEKSKN